MPKRIDAITRKWIKNKADELAVKQGCFMNLKRGQFICDWIEAYCHLYEGVKLESDGNLPRIKLIDWQRNDLLMPLFGWQRHSEDHDREIRRFRKAGVFLPKKSGKSPTLAAIGLYMLIAEGIQGAKCFSVAKDGKQAMIQQMHAIQMVKASPFMADPDGVDFCELNKSTGRIAHLRSNSSYSVISAENIDGQQGLNSVFIGVDETAVVDRRTMAVLEYAGAHAVEPLQLEVSTAGNNPDGYGKQQFDYGRAVNRGANPDIEFFHLEFSVDDNISEKEFEDDFENQITKCNPSIGVTVYMGELKASFERSKGSLQRRADFMMYRGNRWQASTNPWLNIASWQQCVAPEMYKPRALARKSRGVKHDAYGAIDLSQVYDFCSFTLAIPHDDGRIQTLTLLWLSKRYAEMNNHLAPFMDWGKNGFIELVDADIIDHEVVARDVRKLCSHFNVIHITGDQMFAQTCMQMIVNGVHDDNGECLSEGVGCEYYWFKQTNDSYAKPTDDFEGMVLTQQLIHENNPCINWQAGHCEVHADTFGKKRPVKPKGNKGDEIHHKKIDCICTLVMSTNLAKMAIESGRYRGGISSI